MNEDPSGDRRNPDDLLSFSGFVPTTEFVSQTTWSADSNAAIIPSRVEDLDEKSVAALEKFRSNLAKLPTAPEVEYDQRRAAMGQHPSGSMYRHPRERRKLRDRGLSVFRRDAMDPDHLVKCDRVVVTRGGKLAIRPKRRGIQALRRGGALVIRVLARGRERLRVTR